MTQKSFALFDLYTGSLLSSWVTIRSQLISKGFKSKLLDELFMKTRISSSQRGELIARLDFGEGTAVECLCSSPVNYRGKGTFTLGDGYDTTIALVESVLDAIAYRQMNPDIRVVAIFSTDSDQDVVRDLVRHGQYHVICAFVDTPSADFRARQIKSVYPGLERVAPPRNKKWRDVLCQYKGVE